MFFVNKILQRSQPDITVDKEVYNTGPLTAARPVWCLGTYGPKPEVMKAEEGDLVEKMYFIWVKEHRLVQLVKDKMVDFETGKINTQDLWRSNWFFDSNEENDKDKDKGKEIEPSFVPYPAETSKILEDNFLAGSFWKSKVDICKEPPRYVLQHADGSFRQYRMTKHAKPQGRLVCRGWKGLISAVHPEYPTSPHFQVFGVPLETLMTHPLNAGREVPLLVESCVSFLLQEECLKTEGIFRISVSFTELDHYKKQWDSGHDVKFGKAEAHEAACLLKLFIRELPEPLCTKAHYGSWLDAMSSPDPLDTIKKILAQIPTTNREIMKKLFQLLRKLDECSADNKMNASNLSVTWSPNIFPSETDFVSAQKFLMVTNTMISNVGSLFT